MDDRKAWDLRGPVRTCRLERTWYTRLCGSEDCQTEASGDSTAPEFRADGALARHEHRKPDGSEWAATSHYSDDGRLTRTESAGPRLYEYDNAGLSPLSYPAPNGEERIGDSYAYDGGPKIKTVFVDPSARPPDAWSVEGTHGAYPSHGATQVTTIYAENARPAEVLFRNGEPHRREHRYDGRVRRIESRSGIGPLQETRTATE